MRTAVKEVAVPHSAARFFGRFWISQSGSTDEIQAQGQGPKTAPCIGPRKNE